MIESSSTNDTDSATYAAVDVLASDFLARYRNGDRPSIEDYAIRHPAISDQIRRMFPLVASVEKLKVDQQVSSDGTATLAGRTLERLGDFRIIREIGRGGMGIVFEAIQESLGRPVAIKVLPKQCLLDAESLQRFRREAQMAAAMHHSNIVPVFGTGDADGSHYLVMQYIPGEPLDRILSSLDEPMPPGQLTEIGIQLADAIAYAHENGVLHRDIKPANILIDDDGTALVTDFGIARNISDDPTITSTLSGSLRYMAPERFRGASDERSDVYSIGLTLFEIATGQPAFTSEDPDELIRSMTNPASLSVRKLRSGVPIDLETIILKAVAPDPKIRYQTAAELSADLKRFHADEPIAARRISWVQRGLRWCRRNPKLAIAVFVAASSLIAATAVSTTAYVATSSANQRSLAALNESEQSLNLAVQSLDGVVEVVSLAHSVSTVGVDSSDAVSDELALPDISISPSPYSARVLERIQPLYERLAQQAPSRPDIILQMVDASVQLARIQNQLGRTAGAIDTLESSIAMLDVRATAAQVSNQAKALRLGRLYNELGTAYQANLDAAAADKAFNNALQVLQASSLQPSGKLELVRSHLALGSLTPSLLRRGRLEEAERDARTDHIVAAMSVLKELDDPVAQEKSAKILTARCWFAFSRLSAIPPNRRDHFDTAVEVLRQQLEQTPDDASVRFELVQVLGDVNVRRDQQRRQMMASASRLEQALTELQPLRSRHPATPAFSVAEVHLRHKLSSLARSQNRFSEGESHLSQAITIQSELVEAWPDSVLHRCWRALLYRSQMQCAKERNDDAAAAAALQLAKKDLQQISPESNDHPFVVRTREIISGL